MAERLSRSKSKQEKVMAEGKAYGSLANAYQGLRTV